MVVLITGVSSTGKKRRCDACCYNAKHTHCRCVCGGANHGHGLDEATKNSSKIIEKANILTAFKMAQAVML